MWYARALKIVGNFLLALMICLPIAAIPSEKTVKAETWIVNTSEDAHDLDITDGECNTTMGSHICTLRAAIEQAYQFDIINFSEGMTGATIYLHYDLESLILRMNHVTIDGFDRNITVSGELMSHAPDADKECLRIGENYNTVEFITFRDCPSWGISVGEGDYGDDNIIYGVTLLGNGSGGITFNEDDGDGLGGNHNTVDFSYIGSSSSNPTSCIVSESNSTGVAFGQWVHLNHIEHSNILCNAFDGIDSYDADSNYIYGNVIAGNGWEGIYLTNDTSYTTIKGNYIGTLTGTDEFGNGYDGIKVEGASHNITIGGPSLADGNIISGNVQSGIYITGGSNTITINNNLIGIDYYRNTALPNGHAGIAILNNWISSASEAAILIGDSYFTSSHQYISGNNREGVYIQSANNIQILESNLIGRGEYGVSPVIPLGNGLEGVRLVTTDDVIVKPYAVAFNGWTGVAVEGDVGSVRNMVVPMLVYLNGGLPIDLDNNGHTANDMDDDDKGVNTLLNYPEVTDIGGGTMSGYVSCGYCTVYFFVADRDPSLPGGGYRTFMLASTVADVSGGWDITYPLYGFTISQLTMMTVDLNAGPNYGNSSELSPRPVTLTFLPLLTK